MLVSSSVHPLVGGHGEDKDLIDLTDPQTRDPDAVEQGHDHHEEYPGGTEGRALQVVEIGLLLLLGVGAGRGEVLVAAPGGEEGQEGQKEQVEDEEVVVLLPDTVAHPGTVMVEGADTAVTAGAVLRPHRLALQTGPAEADRLQHALVLVILHQLNHPP